MNAIAKRLGILYEAWKASGVLGYALIFIWALYPYILSGIYHPSDTIGFNAWLQGLVVPQSVTGGMLIVGSFYALLYLATLTLIQLIVVAMLYRRIRFFLDLSPAALGVACIGNALWWMATGYFDFLGFLEGLLPISVTLLCEAVCERYGAKFVFGSDRPQYSGF